MVLFRMDHLMFLTFLLSYACAQEMLYFTDLDRKNLFKMSASGGSHIPACANCSFDKPIAIAHDPIREYIYWTEGFGIGRLSITTGRKDFNSLPKDSVPDGLAVDCISNMLYLTDTGRNVIQIIDFEKKTNKTFFFTKVLDQPRAIAVYPEMGWMFWSDWGYFPRIEKAKMDGTGRRTLVETNLTWPNGIALDKPARKLYFCDGKSSSVQSINLEGGGRATHFSGSEGAYHFFGIAVDDQYIYLTSWRHRHILRMRKVATGLNTLERLGASYGNRIGGIVVVGSSYQLPGSNACSLRNGGCSHYCLPIPGGRSCACPGGQQCLSGPSTDILLSTSLATTEETQYAIMTTSNSSMLTPGPECGDNQWQYSAETELCYNLQKSSSGLSWDEAEYRCRALDAHLVCPSSAARYDVVVAMVRQTQLFYTDVWIGLHNENGASGQTSQQRQDGWKWVDGSTYTFKTWETNEPEEGEKYGRMKYGMWWGIKGGSYSYFLCQKEPVFSDAISQSPMGENTETDTKKFRIDYRYALLPLLLIPIILAIVVIAICMKRRHPKADGGQEEWYCQLNQLAMDSK